jgi:hypothetical protein
MAKTILSPSIVKNVIARANKCCEYCQSQDRYSPNRFTIDHVTPESIEINDDFENLAYACFLCNRLKSNKLVGFDALTQTFWPIFNPRLEKWAQHFAWNENASTIIGITPIGRATIKELQLNREKLIEYRAALLVFGVHPPKMD